MINPEPSLWSFIENAGPVVKIVLGILLCASVASWTIIIQRSLLFSRNFNALMRFEERFWSGVDMNELFRQISQQQHVTGLVAIFQAGFQEFRRLSNSPRHTAETIISGVQRAMRITHSREIANLEQHLTFLATVGSISPYVGLFGTVWGIMTSFCALGAVQQATISMVAPGISEALIATAVGLFAAIPAVVAYNRFNNNIERCNQQYEVFQEELITILQRNLATVKEAYAETV